MPYYTAEQKAAHDLIDQWVGLRQKDPTRWPGCGAIQMEPAFSAEQQPEVWAQEKAGWHPATWLYEKFVACLEANSVPPWVVPTQQAFGRRLTFLKVPRRASVKNHQWWL